MLASLILLPDPVCLLSANETRAVVPSARNDLDDATVPPRLGFPVFLFPRRAGCDDLGCWEESRCSVVLSRLRRARPKMRVERRTFVASVRALSTTSCVTLARRLGRFREEVGDICGYPSLGSRVEAFPLSKALPAADDKSALARRAGQDIMHL